MAATGFSFRGSDRVLILGGVLVLLWAWNPDALKRIFPGLPPFPGTGHKGAEEDAAPAPAAPEEPSPFVPSPWWGVPTPDPAPSPSPAPAAPVQTSPAPAAPRCYEPGSICAGVRLGVRSGGVSPGPWGCPMVRCDNGYQYNSAATYPSGTARTMGAVHSEGVFVGWRS